MLWTILIILVLAAVFFRFTTVKEGTAKVIVRLGGFKKAIMSWQGYKFDRSWNVAKGWMWHLPGGLRFVGIWPLDKVYKYNFRWRNVELVKGEERIEFHEKVIDYIFVRPDIYWTDIKNAETKPPERIPLNIQFLVTLRVINPFKALFRAPSNWNENTMSRLNALFRVWVGIKTLDEILAIRKEPQRVWDELGKDPLVQMFEENWGILVEVNGIEIRDIGLLPEYQAAAAIEKKMEFEAKARAVETVGTVIEMMARSRGKEPEDIKKEIDANPVLQSEFLGLAKDLVVRKIGIEGRAYADIRVTGAQGFERMLLNALAVWQRMPKGKPNGREKRERKEEVEATEEEGEEREKPKKTFDELAEETRRQREEVEKEK